MRLSTRLMLLLLLLAIAPLAVGRYLAYDSGRRWIEQDTFNRLLSINALKQADFDRWVRDSGQLLRVLANRPLVRQDAAVLTSLRETDPGFQAARGRILETHLRPALPEGSFRSFCVLRASDGLTLACTDKTLEGKYRESEPYFIQGKTHTYVGSPAYSLSEGGVVMHISTPIQDEAGQTAAVLVGHPDLKEMSGIMLQRSGSSATEETYLVNKFNFFVTDSRFQPGVALNRALYTDGVNTCLRHTDGSGFYVDYRGVPVMGVYRWLPETEMCILTEVDQAEAFALVVALRNETFAIGALVALIAAGLGIFFARSITGPLRGLVWGAAEIARGNLSYRIPVKSEDELGRLSAAFNAMTDSLNRSRAETLHGQSLLLALSQAGTAVQTARTPDEVYRTIASSVAGLGYHALIFTTGEDRLAPDLDRTQLVLAHSTFDPAPMRVRERLVGLRVREDSFVVAPGGVYDRVFSDGQAVLFDPLTEGADLSEAERTEMEGAAAAGIRQGVIARMGSGDAAPGVLAVVGADLTEADVPAIATFANQAGAALENARLYGEARARAVQLEAALAELQEAQERLVRQEKLAVLGQLSGGVGHELRNPLGAIKNAAYFLHLALEAPEPDVKESLDIIDREVAASEKIISDLLDFARTRPPTRGKVDLNAVLRETLARHPAPDEVEAATELDDSLPTIMADADQLRQVFTNVVVNALQAMPHGGRLVVRTARVPGDSQRSDRIAVSVSDTGAGMTEEARRKLFEPLFTTKARGIGLGLAIAKGLVEGHNGAITVRSEAGHGSTFIVELPIGPDTAAGGVRADEV